MSEPKGFGDAFDVFGGMRPIDWRRPPPIVHRADAPVVRPNPTRAIVENVEPAPAEIIADLDLIDVTKRGVPVSARRRKRALDKMAIQCIDRGEPFVYHGRRFPGVDG